MDKSKGYQIKDFTFRGKGYLLRVVSVQPQATSYPGFGDETECQRDILCQNGFILQRYEL
jgi:hypothetical protein